MSNALTFNQCHGFRFRIAILFSSNCVLLLLICGCGNKPSRVLPPKLAANASETAIQEFDTDGNGILSANELRQAPFLSLKRLDTNQDGGISAEEISFRINKWKDSDVGMMAYDINLSLNGKPLEGATISLEPMGFLGDAVLPATGVSNEDGLVPMSVDDEHRPAPNLDVVHCGFYKIRISKKEGDQELIPAKYNVATELGCEIAPDTRSEINAIRLHTR